MSKRRAIPPPTMTGDPCLDLVASVFRLAIKDAGQGDPDAIEWLSIVAPNFAEKLPLQASTRHPALQESRRKEFVAEGA